MKVAQTDITEAEYGLLADYARKHGLTLKEAPRAAARLLVLSDKADPNDPIFNLSIAPSKGKTESVARDHDKHLYRGKPRSS